jgi:hypothetical protein
MTIFFTHSEMLMMTQHAFEIMTVISWAVLSVTIVHVPLKDGQARELPSLSACIETSNTMPEYITNGVRPVKSLAGPFWIIPTVKE